MSRIVLASIALFAAGCSQTYTDKQVVAESITFEAFLASVPSKENPEMPTEISATAFDPDVKTLKFGAGDFSVSLHTEGQPSIIFGCDHEGGPIVPGTFELVAFCNRSRAAGWLGASHDTSNLLGTIQISRWENIETEDPELGSSAFVDAKFDLPKQSLVQTQGNTLTETLEIRNLEIHLEYQWREATLTPSDYPF